MQRTTNTTCCRATLLLLLCWQLHSLHRWRSTSATVATAALLAAALSMPLSLLLLLYAAGEAASLAAIPHPPRGTSTGSTGADTSTGSSGGPPVGLTRVWLEGRQGHILLTERHQPAAAATYGGLAAAAVHVGWRRAYSHLTLLLL